MTGREWFLYLICSLIVASTFGVGMLLLWWIERRRYRGEPADMIDETDQAGC